MQGIKVLDLSRVSPAAYCTMILGDLGAEVLKVEAVTVKGVVTEGTAVSPETQEGRLQAAHFALNRNKTSLALNLKTQAGREIFLKLCQEYDVVLECFRPGVVDELGIGYEAVNKVNPQIVYCSMSGYGQYGPYRNLPGHDINYIGMAGVLDLLREPGRRPVIPLNLIGDLAGGALFAALGIMAALIARNNTGRGQYIDIAFTDAVISLIAATPPAWEFFRSGAVPLPAKGPVAGEFPYNQAYPTKDGRYITIACVGPIFWERLCRAIGREDLVSSQLDTGDKKDDLFATLCQVFLTRTGDAWFSLLSAAGVPVGKVNRLDEVFQDQHFRQRDMIIEVQDPKLGKVSQVGIPIKFSGTPGSVRNLLPFLGEHTRAVLARLGYSPAEIERLEQDGIVQ